MTIQEKLQVQIAELYEDLFGAIFRDLDNKPTVYKSVILTTLKRDVEKRLRGMESEFQDWKAQLVSDELETFSEVHKGWYSDEEKVSVCDGNCVDCVVCQRDCDRCKEGRR